MPSGPVFSLGEFLMRSQQANSWSQQANPISTNEEVGPLPADNIQNHNEVVVLEVGHVCSQQIGFHFQLDVLGAERGGQREEDMRWEGESWS